jgi:hypothetical protein
VWQQEKGKEKKIIMPSMGPNSPVPHNSHSVMQQDQLGVEDSQPEL